MREQNLAEKSSAERGTVWKTRSFFAVFLFHRIIILFLLTHLVSFYVLKKLKSQHSIKPDGTCLHVMTYRFVTKVSKFSHLFTFSIYTRYLFKRLNMHSVGFHSMFRRNTVRLKKNRDSAMCIPKLILTDLTQKVGWLLHFVVIINYQLTLHLYNQLRGYDIALATLQSVDDPRPKLFRSQYSGACSDVLILFLLPFKRLPRKLPKEYQPLW